MSASRLTSPDCQHLEIISLKARTAGFRRERLREDVAILANRDELYRQAREANPSRWSGATRNWERTEVVVLNPDKTQGKLEKAA